MGELNIIKNADFEQGQREPKRWTWRVDAGRASWAFDQGRGGNGDRAIRVESADKNTSAAWVQRVRCKGDQYYRIEAVVRCELDGGGNGDGLRMTVRSVGRETPIDEPARRSGWRRTGDWDVWRDIYKTPEDAKQLDVEVRLEGVAGTAWIDEVRAIPIEEPELCSHVLGVPPPPYGYPAPRQVKTAAVVMPDHGRERLVNVVAGRLGQRNVKAVGPKDFDATSKMDAVILQGDDWGQSVPNLQQLLYRATSQMVIVSLGLLAKIVNRQQKNLLDVKRNTQDDDPIHAKVMYANFITRGFALEDVIPLRWEDGEDYYQRYIRRSRDFKAFCKKHGFLTVLTSEGDTDAKSEHPAVLYRETSQAEPGGGLVVMDLDALFGSYVSTDSANVTATILFNILGQTQTSIGQFVAPETKLDELKEIVKDAADRFPEMRLREGKGESEPKWRFDLGQSGESYGLARHRPTMLVRTGMQGDDIEGVYGALIWLKGLCRPEPYGCRYLKTLDSRHSIRWIPLVRPELWAEHVSPADLLPDASPFDENVDMVLDVTRADNESIQLIVPNEANYGHFQTILPKLYETMGQGRFLYYSPAPSAKRGERHTMDWRLNALTLEVVVDPNAFRGPFDRAALNANTRILRLRLPDGADFTSGTSLRLTELAASMIEWIIGLHLGLVVVNRDEAVQSLNLGTWQRGAARETILAGDGAIKLTREIETGCRLKQKLAPGDTWLISL